MNNSLQVQRRIHTAYCALIKTNFKPRFLIYHVRKIKLDFPVHVPI